MAVAAFELKSKKPVFGSGTFRVRQSVAHDLTALCRHLEVAAYDLSGAAERSRQTYPFPAQTANAPLLVDEGLRLPVSLGTALQTSAMYQGLGWNEASTRRYSAVEFFRQYCSVLLPETVRLMVRRQVALDLSASSCLLTVARGEPTSLRLRHLSGTLGPRFAQLQSGSNFEFEVVPTVLTSYQRFAGRLLADNLRPMVNRLIEVSESKPEIFWDIAIETLLSSLESSPSDQLTKYQARQALLIEELHPGDRLITPASLVPGSLLAGDSLIYLKRKCCQKFTKNKRCSDCPGLKKRN